MGNFHYVTKKGRFMTEQKKLDILIGDFRQLEESRKDYIRELTRKLADIHKGKGPDITPINKIPYGILK
jgi:hypothetical protein